MSLTVIEQVREHLYGIANEPDHKARRTAFGPDAKALALALLAELDAHGPSERGDGRWCAGCTIEYGDGASFEAAAVALFECPTRRRIITAIAPLLAPMTVDEPVTFDFSRVADPEFEKRFRAEWERALRGPKRVLSVPLHIEHDAAVAELARLRTLRLRLPDEAIVPEVHTPERVDAYLRARGWRVATPGVTAYIWEHPDHPANGSDRHSKRLFMPTSNCGTDYGRRISILVSDLAAIYDMGELQILADIAASTVEAAR